MWSVSSFFGFQELKRCGEDRGVQPEQVMDVMKVLQFVRIRNVAAVPSDEDVARMPRGEGEVAGMSLWRM